MRYILLLALVLTGCHQAPEHGDCVSYGNASSFTTMADIAVVEGVPAPLKLKRELSCIGHQPPVVSGAWSTCLLWEGQGPEDCPPGSMGTYWECPEALAPEVPGKEDPR